MDESVDVECKPIHELRDHIAERGRVSAKCVRKAIQRRDRLTVTFEAPAAQRVRRITVAYALLLSVAAVPAGTAVACGALVHKGFFRKTLGSGDYSAALMLQPELLLHFQL